MTGLLERVRNYARRHDLWQPGDHVLVALSGGPDSVVLLHVMNEVAGEHDVRVGAAHINYGLRGAESDGDAQFCRQLCERLGLPFHLCHPGTEREGNVQDWARRERFRLLRDVRDRESYTAAATGHTADDRAETLIIQLFRGGAPPALANMTPRTSTLIRPLLGQSRRDVMSYLQAHRIPFRVDRSNRSSQYRRNRVRNELLPLAADIFQTDVTAALVGEADMLGLIGGGIEQVATGLSESAQQVDQGYRMNLDLLTSHHPGLQLMVLRQLAARLGATPGRHQTLRLLELIQSAPGYRVELGHGVTAERGREDVWLLKQIDPQPAIPVNLAGVIHLPDGSRLEVQPVEPVPPHPGGRTRARMAIPDPEEQLVVRRARPGDRMQPFGMNGSRLVFDMLGEAGVPSQRREHSWVLATNETIYWLLGVRQSEAGRVTPGARPVYEFAWLTEA